MEYVKKSDVLKIIEHEKSLRISYDADIVLFAVEKSVNELEEKAEQYCHWYQQDFQDCETWLTSCEDKLFNVINGTPKENDMIFCPYCGKNIIEHDYNEQFANYDEECDDSWINDDF